MSPFLKQHLFGGLVLGVAFGTVIGFSAFALPPGSVLQEGSRCLVALIAIVLVKLLFDAGTSPVRMVLLTTCLRDRSPLAAL